MIIPERRVRATALNRWEIAISLIDQFSIIFRDEAGNPKRGKRSEFPGFY